jgi:hypothetical protein
MIDKIIGEFERESEQQASRLKKAVKIGEKPAWTERP